MIRRIAGFAALLVAVGTLTGQDKTAIKTDASYYPTGIGSKWTYSVVDRQKELVVTAAKTEKIGDQECIVLEAAMDGKAVSTEHFALVKGTYQRYRHNTANVVPPLPFLKADSKKDDTWKADFEVRFIDESQPGTKKEVVAKAKTTYLVADDKIKVPAGEYDAIVVRGVTEEEGKVTKTAVWYVKGIGPVRQEFDLGTGGKFVLELKAADIKK